MYWKKSFIDTEAVFVLYLTKKRKNTTQSFVCTPTIKVEGNTLSYMLFHYASTFCIIRDKEASRLTEYGFQFLVCPWKYVFFPDILCKMLHQYHSLWLWQLMETNAQLWYIIREYIANAEVRTTLPVVLAVSIDCCTFFPWTVINSWSYNMLS